MREALLIAKREYMEQIKGRTFRVTTVLIPLVFIAIFAIMFLAQKNSGTGKHIAIASADADLANRVREQVVSNKAAHTTVDVVAPVTDVDRAALVQKVEKKQLDGFLWVEAKSGSAPDATYEARESGDFATQERLSSALNQAVMQQRLSAHGLSVTDVQSLTKKIGIDTLQIKNGKATSSNAISSLLTAYIMAFLLSFTCVMYGMNVGRSVIQEKTSRVFEVMLASVRAEDLLTGKLLGIGAVGLTQLGIWIASATVLSSTAIIAKWMSGPLKFQVSALEIALFCVYFILGYLLYSSLFAGLAATVESEQEFQQYTPLAAVPIWLSFSLITFIVSDPNSKLSVLISMFPPCAPITMFLRIASQMPPLWQIGASVLLMALSILAILWFSSKIYRIGILMYGKRATLPEILRWLRYS